MASRSTPASWVTGRSPWAFFGLAGLLFVPFPVLSTFLHVPGLPKNTPVTDFALAFVPTVAAMILTHRADGWSGVRRLLRRVVDFRKIRKAWLLPTLLLPVFCLAATYGLTTLTGWTFQSQPRLPMTTMLLFTGVYVFAAIGEELGWSGYALEPLQQRFGALGGSLVLGTLWWLFHAPSILESGQGPTLVTLGMVGALGTRVLWAWLFNNTAGSVCAVIIVHAVSNLCGAYVPTIPTSATQPVVLLLAVVVTVLWGPRTLMRFRRTGHPMTAHRQEKQHP